MARSFASVKKELKWQKLIARCAQTLLQYCNRSTCFQILHENSTMGALNLQAKIKIFLNDVEWQYKLTDVSALLLSNALKKAVMPQRRLIYTANKRH